MDRKAEIDAVFCRVLDFEEQLEAETAGDPAEFAKRRARFLEEACAGDAQLRAAVERLLEEDEEDLLPNSVEDLLLEAAAATQGKPGLPPDLMPRDRVGSFRIVEELGRGGMAVVYLAERVEGGFHQKVALKILQRGLVSENLLRRFEQERQILASLNHPHIARLLEGGVTPDGRPYFALEHILGRPLDRYCDEEELTVEERLRLFATCCHAVQHAHGQLVVHRDLKPANILVTDSGEIKLLDFGIAKLLDPEPAWGTAAPPTRTAVRLMTPEYASPEQIRGETVGTAADIYQLGLILYELLTGRRPHTLEGLSLLEAERLLENRRPTRPSTAVTRPDGKLLPEALSHARGTTPKQLRRRLKGDLDAIVLKALRLEPEKRYESADQLAAEVGRFLDGRPVMARRGNTLYHAAKSFRRHRLAVATALVVLASLSAYAITATIQGRRVALERDIARFEANKAEQVKNFLLTLFWEADPAVSRGREWTARDLLDRGAQRLADAELDDQPEVKAELLDAVGRVYRRLGDYEAAQPVLDQALALRRQQEAGGIELAQSLFQSGVLAQQRNDLDAAEALFQEALHLVTENPVDDDPDRAALAAACRARLAALTQERGDYPTAEEQLRNAVDEQRRLLGDGHPDVAESLSRLARVLFFRDRLSEAEEVQRESVTALTEAFGADHPRTLEARMGVGFLRLYQGDAEGAKAHQQKTLEDARRVLGDRHPLVAAILISLANVYQDQLHWDPAEALYREAIEINRQVLEPDHAETIIAINDLGTMLLEKGDPDAAEPLLRQALEANERRYGADHPRVADNLYNLGTLHLRAGRYKAAEAAHRRCLTIREAVQHPGHSGIARSRATVGILQVMANTLPGDAEEQLKEAIEAFRALGEQGESHLPRALTALGWVLLAGDRGVEAEPLLKEAVDRRQASSPPDSRFRAETELAYGKALLSLGRGEGREWVERAAAVLRGALREADWLWREMPGPA